jgi:hypothetical protein
MRPGAGPDAVISDVGSSKASIVRALSEALPTHTIIPAHPVAGTEHSGPDAGFASLFRAAGASSPRPKTRTPPRSSASPPCGRPSAPRSRSWMPRTMTSCWPSPAICRT